MTQKEKAIKLVDDFYIIIGNNYSKGDGFSTQLFNEAVKCALKAVDEIILSAPFEPVDTDWDEAGSSAQYWYPQKLEDSAKWWAEVRQEIEKL